MNTDIPHQEMAKAIKGEVIQRVESEESAPWDYTTYVPVDVFKEWMKDTDEVRRTPHGFSIGYGLAIVQPCAVVECGFEVRKTR